MNDLGELFDPNISIPNVTDGIIIDTKTNTATVSANTQEAKATIITDVLNNKTNLVDKVTHDGQTYDIKDLNNLELRNAIDGIDKVSFLLSNITIKVGEKLDLGSHGVYTVKGEDTLSMIAQNLNDGTVTKDLVALNPWLFDDNRIKFDYPTKVLIAEGTKIDTHTNHTINGENTNDFIKDANGNNAFEKYKFSIANNINFNKLNTIVNILKRVA